MKKTDKTALTESPALDAYSQMVNELVQGRLSSPFQILGPHPIERDGEKLVAIRVFRPDAKEVTVLSTS